MSQPGLSTSPIPVDLRGRIALVIGASRGIGRTTAEALAAAGADVLAVARNASHLEEVATIVRSAGRRCEPIACDIAEGTGLLAALEAHAKAGMAPTIVVHAAATIFAHQRLQFVEMSEADRMHAVDVRSAVEVSRWALSHMVVARWGRVIFLGSLAAQMAIRGAALYAMNKAALEGLARGIALDYSHRNITANVVSLGFVETERLQERISADANAREKLIELTATKRLIAPSEVASLIVFLCSEHARSITGAVLDMTAGAHLATR